MQGIKEYNKKILSLKNTQKITSAMKMIAAAKLRRVEKLKEAAYPMYRGVHEFIHQLKDFSEYSFKYFFDGFHDVKRAQIFAITSDRGLCGAFNTNVMKRSIQLFEELTEKNIEVSFSCIGRRGYEFLNKRGYEIETYFPKLPTDINSKAIDDIGNNLLNCYSKDRYQQIWIVRNEFVSALSRNVSARKILPFSGIPDLDTTHENNRISDEYIIEPGIEAVTKTLFPKFAKFIIYYALLDSLSSEHSARMTAMDSATRNCNKLKDQYTLLRNRARQAAITKELIEIVAGKEVLQ
jgi:F-type H+-transporting ATPase subunit gamma